MSDPTPSRHGQRTVTSEDRKRALVAEILRTRSPLTITDGMRRHLRSERGWRAALRRRRQHWTDTRNERSSK